MPRPREACAIVHNTSASRVSVPVTPTDEEWIIAKNISRLLKGEKR